MSTQFHDPKKVIFFPKKKLPKAVVVGEFISLTSKTGVIRSYKVVRMHDDMVSLDGNIPSTHII